MVRWLVHRDTLFGGAVLVFVHNTYLCATTAMIHATRRAVLPSELPLLQLVSINPIQLALYRSGKSFAYPLDSTDPS